MHSALCAVFCLLFEVNSSNYLSVSGKPSIRFQLQEILLPYWSCRPKQSLEQMAADTTGFPGCWKGTMFQGAGTWQNTQGVKFNCETASSHSA